MLSSRTKIPASWLQGRLDAWRDRRLRNLPDRKFCRRISLAGWERVASAIEERRGLLITVGQDGLPGATERALVLFAAAIPAEKLAAPQAAEALAVGGILYAPAGSPLLLALQDADAERLFAQAHFATDAESAADVRVVLSS